MTAVDNKPNPGAKAAYTAPECRAADTWTEGHRLCAGNADTTVREWVVERLHCDCPCHT